MLNITYMDRKTNIWIRDRTKVEDIISNVRKNEVALGRTHQPHQRRPMDLTCHDLDTIRQVGPKGGKGHHPNGGEPTWTNTVNGGTRSGRGQHKPG